MLIAVTMLLAVTSCTASGNGANEKTVTSSVKEHKRRKKNCFYDCDRQCHECVKA